jgi:hypothetical protein
MLNIMSELNFEDSEESKTFSYDSFIAFSFTSKSIKVCTENPLYLIRHQRGLGNYHFKASKNPWAY